MHTLYIASDHGGIQLKDTLASYLNNEVDVNIKNLGTDTTDSVDYSDYANKLTEKMNGEDSKGILICKSGIGMSIAANKAVGIRAALVYNSKVAELSRRHNNANVICFGADFISEEEAKMATKKFITTDFEGGRHQRRINKIKDKVV